MKPPKQTYTAPDPDEAFLKLRMAAIIASVKAKKAAGK